MNNTPFNKPKQIYINPDELETIEPKIPPLPVIAKAQTSQAEEIANIENQIAMNETQNALKQFARSQEEEELKKQTIANLMNQLQKQVDVPKRVTIADIMNGSNFGERLGTLAQYAQQPEFLRNIGNLFGPMHRNPQTGEYTSYGERLGREAEARLQADQKRAMEDREALDKLNLGIYGIMNGIDTEAMREDRFNRQMAMQNEQFYQSLGQRAAENAAKIQADREALQRQMEQKDIDNYIALEKLDIDRKKADNPPRKPLSDTQTKELSDMEKSINHLSSLYDKYLTADNSLFGQQGALRANLAKDHPILYAPHDNEITLARQDLELLRQKYAKALEGGRMSDQDRAFYQNVLVSQSLTKENFLKALRDVLKDEKAAYNIRLKGIERQNKDIDDYEYYEEETPKNKTTSINVDRNAVEEELRKRGLI